MSCEYIEIEGDKAWLVGDATYIVYSDTHQCGTIMVFKNNDKYAYIIYVRTGHPNFSVNGDDILPIEVADSVEEHGVIIVN